MENFEGKKSVLIVGGGAGGLYAGWRLSQKGFNVTILERKRFLGGLGTSIKKNNCLMDIGPHYISLNKNSRIFDDVMELLGEKGIRRLPSVESFFKSFYKNEILETTPKLSHVMKNDKNSVIKKLFQNTFSNIDSKKKSSEEYLISLYGKSVFESLCKPVLIQTYGEIPPLEITKKLYKPITIKKIVNYVNKNQKKNELVANSSTFSCYFKNGMGSIIDIFEEKIIEAGGEIILDAEITSINHDSPKTIEFVKDDKAMFRTSDIILYSVPLNLAIKWFNDSPDDLNQKFDSSQISNGVLIYFLIDMPKLFDGWILDIYDLTIPFFRITQQTFLSSNVAPKNKTLLCCEMRVKDEDNVWEMTDKVLFNKAKDNLKKIFNLDESMINELNILKLKNLYRPQYYKIKSKDTEIGRYINSFENEYALGTTTFSDTGDNPTRLSHDEESPLGDDSIAYGGFYNSLFRSNQVVESVLLDNK